MPAPDYKRDQPDLQQKANESVGQIQKDIVKIMTKLPSDLQSLLSRYIRCASPAFVEMEDSEFPKSLYRHPRNPHASVRGGWGNVLCFHVGDAILSYYNLYRGIHNDEEFAAIQYLHEIATVGTEFFKVTGDDTTGYMLMTEEMVRAQVEAKGEN